MQPPPCVRSTFSLGALACAVFERPQRLVLSQVCCRWCAVLFGLGTLFVCCCCWFHLHRRPDHVTRHVVYFLRHVPVNAAFRDAVSGTLTCFKTFDDASVEKTLFRVGDIEWVTANACVGMLTRLTNVCVFVCVVVVVCLFLLWHACVLPGFRSMNQMFPFLRTCFVPHGHVEC